MKTLLSISTTKTLFEIVWDRVTFGIGILISKPVPGINAVNIQILFLGITFWFKVKEKK